MYMSANNLKHEWRNEPNQCQTDFWVQIHLNLVIIQINPSLNLMETRDIRAQLRKSENQKITNKAIERSRAEKIRNLNLIIVNMRIEELEVSLRSRSEDDIFQEISESLQVFIDQSREIQIEENKLQHLIVHIQNSEMIPWKLAQNLCLTLNKRLVTRLLTPQFLNKIKKFVLAGISQSLYVSMPCILLFFGHTYRFIKQSLSYDILQTLLNETQMMVETLNMTMNSIQTIINPSTLESKKHYETQKLERRNTLVASCLLLEKISECPKSNNLEQLLAKNIYFFIDIHSNFEELIPELYTGLGNIITYMNTNFLEYDLSLRLIPQLVQILTSQTNDNVKSSVTYCLKSFLFRGIHNKNKQIIKFFSLVIQSLTNYLLYHLDNLSLNSNMQRKYLSLIELIYRQIHLKQYLMSTTCLEVIARSIKNQLYQVRIADTHSTPETEEVGLKRVGEMMKSLEFLAQFVLDHGEKFMMKESVCLDLVKAVETFLNNNPQISRDVKSKSLDFIRVLAPRSKEVQAKVLEIVQSFQPHLHILPNSLTSSLNLNKENKNTHNIQNRSLIHHK